ncbi:hypothetical protein GCM10023405_49470 [Streptomonospora salina]
MIVAVLAVCAGGVAVGGPWLLARAGLDGTVLPWAAPCSVDTADGTVMLSSDEARRATTAVALRARGADAPDTSGIDGDALRRLREGPTDGPGPSLTCRVSTGSGLGEQELTDSGLTPRAQALLDSAGEVFGTMSVGGYETGGVSSGHGEDSAHYDGRAVDVFYRPVSEENRREGWLLAHWLVAHAEQLHVAHVIFDDEIWSARDPRGGWQPYEAGDPDNAILRHLDHVHVDVQRGG